VLRWSVEDVAEYVGGLTEGLGEQASEYAQVFQREAINGETFADLSNDDLKELGFDKMGHRKMLLSKIALLKAALSPGVSGETRPQKVASVIVASEEAGAGGRAQEMAEKRGETVSEDTGVESRSSDKDSAKVVDALPQVPTERVERESVIGGTEVEKEGRKDKTEKSADRKRKKAETARKQVDEEDVDHEIRSEDVAHQAWDTLGGERTAELLDAANRKGEKALNTSRLNIVGEGRAGKTAWLLGVSNQSFKETDSTIGVQQSLLEVNKVDMKAGGGVGWSVVRDGSSSIMTAEEAEKRLAAELALAETPEERREREKRAQEALRRAQEEADKIKVYPSSNKLSCKSPPFFTR
jgi:hypothetical protein